MGLANTIEREIERRRKLSTKWDGSSYHLDPLDGCRLRERSLLNNGANSGKAKEESMLIPSQAEKRTSRACVETMGSAS